MVGPGDEIPARTGSDSHLRTSHADREHVIDVLKAAYVYGLVTKDEFDERVSQTLASRTHAELALITADIPAGLAAAPPPPKPVPAKTGLPARANLRPGERVVVAAAVLGGLAFVMAVFAGGAVAGLLALAGTGSALVSLLLVAAQELRSRRNQRSGSQLPPQRGISTGRRSGRPAPAEQLPYVSKPRRRSKADAGRSQLPRPQLSC
jgi:hypothetical protein